MGTSLPLAEAQRASYARAMKPAKFVTTLLGSALILVRAACAFAAESVTNVPTEIAQPLVPTNHSAKSYFKLGVEQFRARQIDRAIVSFSKVIDIDPTNAPAYCNRGNCYRAKLQWHAAAADLSKAIELKPDFAYYYRCRGDVRRELPDSGRRSPPCRGSASGGHCADKLVLEHRRSHGLRGGLASRANLANRTESDSDGLRDPRRSALAGGRVLPQ